MSNTQLIKIENEASFSPSELVIIKARQDVRLNEKSSLELKKPFYDLLYPVYYYLGYNINKEEMDLLIGMVIPDFQSSFPYQTIKEVELAFQKGSHGEYGEFVGLNPGRFNQWMRSFLSDRKRTDALAKENRLKEKEEVKPTEEELFQWSKRFALAAFEDFKKNGYYNDLGNPVYEFLDQLNLIPYTNERKNEIFEQAKTKIVNKSNPKFAINLAEKTAFEKILEGIEAIGKDGKEIVRVEARKIALNLFFKELVEMETELSELLIESKF